MARGGPRKSSQDVLVKSAEFIGWALGGLEKEIAQTRERLTALNAQALKLRSRIGKGEASAATTEKAEATHPVSRRQRRSQMSPEARQRLSELMKRRWAARRNAKD